MVPTLAVNCLEQPLQFHNRRVKVLAGTNFPRTIFPPTNLLDTTSRPIFSDWHFGQQMFPDGHRKETRNLWHVSSSEKCLIAPVSVVGSSSLMGTPYPWFIMHQVYYCLD